jgi:hypothetical protein
VLLAIGVTVAKRFAGNGVNVTGRIVGRAGGNVAVTVGTLLVAGTCVKLGVTDGVTVEIIVGDMVAVVVAVKVAVSEAVALGIAVAVAGAVFVGITATRVGVVGVDVALASAVGVGVTVTVTGRVGSVGMSVGVASTPGYKLQPMAATANINSGTSCRRVRRMG